MDSNQLTIEKANGIDPIELAFLEAGASDNGIATAAASNTNGHAERSKPAKRATKKRTHASDLPNAGGDLDCLDQQRSTIDITDRGLPELTEQTWGAIGKVNDPPSLFRHGGIPARLESGDDGAPIIRSVDFHRMRHFMARAATWTIRRGVGDRASTSAVAPPKDVVNDVLATPDMRLPILNRVVEAPVFGPRGELQTEAGYHAASRTIYAPAPGFVVPDVPDAPTGLDIESAREILNEPLRDFPFVSDAELAHALALIMLPFVRDMIDGPTPLHLIEKPTPGTGATLLADLVSFPMTGRPIPAMTEARNEDEWPKRLTAKFRSGSPFLLIDNLRRRLDSAAVASAITSPTWEDRILGGNELAWIPVTCAWLATGNNPALSSEMARRTVRIRLDARVDRPWLRTGFRHPDLRSWATANRGLLVWSILTLGRAWLAAGRPQGAQTLGMFESWSKTMGGIFDVAGIPGFLDNLSDFYEESDSEGSSWRAFMAAWWDKFNTAGVKVAELHPLAVGEGCLSLGDGGDQSQRVVLGKMLAEKRDRVFELECDNLPSRVVIRRGKQHKRAYLWNVEQAI